MKNKLLALILGLIIVALLVAIIVIIAKNSSSEKPSEPGTEPSVSSESASESESETPSESVTEPTTPIEPIGDGNLTDNGLFSNIESLSNKSVPYGNDWDSKDELGLPNGIHYYESLYDKYYPVYRIKNNGEKVLYLTFDEGYEAGFTPKILDTLKSKNVHAVFFLTKQFVDSDPELVQRMINEGHIIGNHTCLHPTGGFPNYVEANGLDSFTDDVAELHKIVYDKFHYTMRLFRFPEGEASERLMAKLCNLGYTSVFWSYAHYDYNTEKQPEVSVTLQRCLDHMAPGAVYLLHAVSSSNTEALGSFIDEARNQGYTFGDFPVDEVSKR